MISLDCVQKLTPLEMLFETCPNDGFCTVVFGHGKFVVKNEETAPGRGRGLRTALGFVLKAFGVRPGADHRVPLRFNMT